jgi:DNA-binding transcriptional ArsR family regulator
LVINYENILMDRIELILHPLRLRILLAVTGREMTSQQLARVMPDVAQATLYRHINRLAEAGILIVVEEKPVRGTVEKVFALDERLANLSEEDLQNLNHEDHLRMFTVFVTSLLKDFERYLNSSADADPAADGVGYHKVPLYMNDEELAKLAAEMGQVMTQYLKTKPNRKRRIFTTIVIPDCSGE